jgi:hypothetical protein
MKNIIISEEEKKIIIELHSFKNKNSIILEQEKIVTDYDKKYDYKQIGNDYFYKLKNTDKWIKASGKGLEAISSKVFKNNVGQPKTQTNNSTESTKKQPTTNVSVNTTKPQTDTRVKNFCPTITKNSEIADLSNIVSFWSEKYPNFEIYGFLNKLMNNFASYYYTQIRNERISCEAALVKLRPEYKDKNSIIVDSLQKLIFIFDMNGKFIGKSQIISGADKQSKDAKVIAQSLLSWDEQANKLGFQWVTGQGYKDKTGENRKYDAEMIYKDTESTKTRFLPKGIFKTGSKLISSSEYAGGSDNVLQLIDNNNKVLGQAIHGYYIEQPRTQALKRAKEVLSTPNDPVISKEFIDLVSSGKVNLSQSYGCINVPNEFLPYLRKYMKDAYVFNIGEDKTNYLASNASDFMTKSMSGESCKSPSSLGATPLDNIA